MATQSGTAHPFSFWTRMILWKQIAIALAGGLALGVMLNITDNAAVAGTIKLVGDAFIAAIKMLVVPLVFVSLVCGMTSIAEIGRMGRIGVKTLAFYLCTTAFAVIIGLLLAILIQPGSGVALVVDAQVDANDAPPFGQILIGIIPTNPFSAAADGNILQIIFFAIIFGLAINLAGAAGQPIRNTFNALNAVIMKLAEIVVSFAPYGVFALITWVAGTYGLEMLMPLGLIILAVYLGCIIHAVVVYGGLIAFVARLSPVRFFKGIIEPGIVSFTSTSSAGTLPVTMSAATSKLGVNSSVASFTLPLGATINMDGTALYQGVTAVFVAQAFGVTLSGADYATIVAAATIASIGTAGVPGGGLIMLCMVLTSVGLPLEGIAIIAGIDRILDMARTALNVAGDSVCTVIVAKSEGEVDLDVFNGTFVKTAS